MTPEALTPRPGELRASDEDRDRAARLLRERAAEGRISLDTFMARLDRVVRARHRGQLDDVLRDLPPSRSRAERLLVDTIGAWSALTGRIRAAWQEPRLPRLLLPAGRTALTIGRTRECDLVLTHPTVSRLHAELRRVEEGWLLADFSSTNGTHVNGGRITAPVLVHPGDVVWFGEVGFRITAPADPARPEPPDA